MNRQKIVSVAKSFVGSCACNKFKQTMAVAIGKVAGVDDNLNQIDWRPFVVANNKVQGVSTCGMFGNNVYNICGIIDELWHIGQGLGVFEEFGRKNDCWIEYNKKMIMVPEPGDLLVLGTNEGTHVCIVDHCDGKILRTIDAGQVCRCADVGHDQIGKQCVKAVIRNWQTITIEGWISLTNLVDNE